MSSNNYILIAKKNNKWIIEHRDASGGKYGDKFPEFDTLEEAAKEANKFQKENEVEYNTVIDL